MTEESNPTTTSVPPASSDTQMDTSQTAIDIKQGDATVEQNAAVGTTDDKDRREAAEGESDFNTLLRELTCVS